MMLLLKRGKVTGARGRVTELEMGKVRLFEREGLTGLTRFDLTGFNTVREGGFDTAVAVLNRFGALGPRQGNFNFFCSKFKLGFHDLIIHRYTIRGIICATF